MFKNITIIAALIALTACGNVTSTYNELSVMETTCPKGGELEQFDHSYIISIVNIREDGDSYADAQWNDGEYLYLDCDEADAVQITYLK